MSIGLREKFQCHAWVSISQTYSREDVFRNIIKELFKDRIDVPDNIAMMDITCLEDTLKRFLQQKKCLIVLDDVWTPEAFDDLSRTLICTDKGSRVLITTREGDVATLASQGHVLTLESLPEDNAWDLFCKKSFSRETNYECPEDLKPLSKEIVSMCKGLPLAIVSVGSLLNVLEKTVEEWRRINDQLSWEIINNSRLQKCLIEDTLKRFLQQKKCLIVLDDVWTPEAFDDLSRTLICTDEGSRVLITTREGDVAALASQGHILTLESLPEDKAWDLFCKKSFPRETCHECPYELKSLSEEVVNKCKGLTLAIVSIGSLLHVREKTVEEWRRINDQLSWEIINNSRLGHIRNILYLSFIYLPTYLKSCFLYCSLFPEDHLLQRKMLVRLWMAEGFIVEKGASTLEEVAEGYLKELVNRNLLQLVERNSFGRIKRFKMHDIVRELAIDLCHKDHFGVQFEEGKCGGSLQRDGRRLVVQKLKKDIQQSFSSVHGLRTFIALDKNMPSFNLLPLLSEKSRYMTVLELSGLPIEKVPDAIGDLFNLRHLGLRDTEVKLLPKSIENLSNLLTLDLSRSDIRELPRGIVKLKNLRHLFAEKLNDQFCRVFHLCNGVCITKGLGNLTNLQTLQALEAQDESVSQLGELRQLRSLRVLNVKGIYCERLSESLVQMPFLSYLDVRASDENEVLVLSALPLNLHKLSLSGRLAEGALLGESSLLQAVEQNLHELRLGWSQLREDPLPSLSRLANLTVLDFVRAYNGEKLEFLTGWFPKLKELYLWDLPNLKQLEIKQGAMATLERLGLCNLGSMSEVPRGIEFLLSLQSLLFFEITTEFLALLRQCSGLADVRWRYSLRD